MANPSGPWPQVCWPSSSSRRSSTSCCTSQRCTRPWASQWVTDSLCSRACDDEGFSLHAQVCVPAGQRERLEHLCRYVARPAIASERLALSSDGRVIYGLRRHWRDGTSAVSFDPLTFIERLAALVPRPRAHQQTYHGALAPAAAYRDLIVPGPSQESAASNAPSSAASPSCAAPPRESNAQRATWAELLKRVFAHAINCTSCSGSGRTHPDHASLPSALWAGDRLRRSPGELG